MKDTKSSGSSRLRCALAAIPCLLVLCTAACQTGPTKDYDPDSGSYADAARAHWELSAAEVAALIVKANGGDSESSFRLSLYYSNSRYWFIEGDRWLVVAADQGSDVAAYNLALQYIAPYHPNPERAKHWMQIAKQRGVPAAVDGLLLIEAMIKEEKNRKKLLKKENKNGEGLLPPAPTKE